MLNLEGLGVVKGVIVPIINNSFQYNRKIYNTEETVDGWYRVDIDNNDVTLLDAVIPELDLKVEKKFLIKGYTYNDSIIFFNFDDSKRRFNKHIMDQLHLSNIRTFSSIEALVWEDKRVYLYRQSFTDTDIYELKTFFDEGINLSGKKHLKPEQKTLYLFHHISKQKQIQKIKQQQIKKERQEKQSKQDAIIESFTIVGANIKKYEVKNNRIYVSWELNNNLFDSVINESTGQVIDAGYCMSGDDAKHSVTSLVLTAKEYDEDGDLYIFNRR